MIFSLEAIEARHGDCLLLHHGDQAHLQTVLIDGGPGRVYEERLRPRLEELREIRSPNGLLKLQLAMVSHLDDDHLNGVLDLLNEICDGQAPVELDDIWINTFASLVGDDEANSAIDTDSLTARFSPESISVIESVPQGQDVRNRAEDLGLRQNLPFDDLVEAPARGSQQIGDFEGLSMTVVAPNQTRIEALRKKWEEEKSPDKEFITFGYDDNSVFNLSSIVVIIEKGDISMLLTGDARGDDILQGLETTDRLENGTAHFDLMKLPHHGSDKNVKTEFFQRVTADNYVVSGDGKYGNPETSTLQMLLDARGDVAFSLFLTNREKRIEDFFEEKARSSISVEYRNEGNHSIVINLGENVDG